MHARLTPVRPDASPAADHDEDDASPVDFTMTFIFAVGLANEGNTKLAAPLPNPPETTPTDPQGSSESFRGENISMAWTWIRPADTRVLSPRPLLDLGVGDGQTAEALVPGAVGLDCAFDALRAARRAGVWPLVAGDAGRLPFRDGSFAVVLAGDLFHHLDNTQLRAVLDEARRVLLPDGYVVAWWYERPGRPMPGSPRYPRNYEQVASLLGKPKRLPLDVLVDPAPDTVGLIGR